MDLFFMGFWKNIGIERIINPDLRLNLRKNSGGIIRITERTVKRNILLNMKKINGKFKAPAQLTILIPDTEQLLYI